VQEDDMEVQEEAVQMYSTPSLWLVR